MQAHQNVRTPTDVDADGDREWLFVQPTETADVSIEETDDGQIEITVPISSTAAHRSGSRMSSSALEAMAAQLREGTVGLWDDHGLDEYGWPEYRRSDMYGWWVDGEVTDDDVLMGTARLREGDERSADLVDQLDQGMPVGFSVGYIPLDEEWVEADEGEIDGDEQRVIRDVDLLETSPVGIPDNPNAYADAPARVIAHSLSEAGVSLDRQSASVIGDGVAEALQTMGDDTDPDASDTGTDDGAGDGADGTEGETNEGDGPEQNQYDEEEVQEIISVIGDSIESALDDAADELLDGDGEGDDDGGDGDEDDGEESEGDNPDDDDDDDDQDSADIPEDVQAELDELRSKVDRLESEGRESAGRKGMAAPGAGDDGETSDADDQGETNDADDQRTALDEAVMLGK